MTRRIVAVLVGSCVAALGLVVTQAAEAGLPTIKTVDAEGVVRSGEEAGCLLLSAPEGSADPYLLVGGSRAVMKPGARLRVTGVLDPRSGGNCRQGIALRVTSAVLIAE